LTPDHGPGLILIFLGKLGLSPSKEMRITQSSLPRARPGFKKERLGNLIFLGKLGLSPSKEMRITQSSLPRARPGFKKERLGNLISITWAQPKKAGTWT
jgi:hypothetical protein